MRIGTNISAINSCRNLGKNNNAIQKDVEKLASGFKINRARDDASGLAITEKMRAQITALDVASRNCEDGISLVQTADGYLEEVHNMMQRMHELGMKSANGILDDDTDRTALQDEFSELQEEIDRISDTANFNNNNLFGGRNETGNTVTRNVLVANGGQKSVPINNTRAAGVQCGDFWVIGGTSGVDYSYADKKLTVLSDKDISIEGTGTVTNDRIEISRGVSANVTIKDVNIDVSSGSGAAIHLHYGSVLNLTLQGANNIKGGSAAAGIYLPGATLIITDKSQGSLNVSAGRYSVGIGGAGDVVINGGNITSNGGEGAAGIGGGAGSGGSVTINGGTVVANGGYNSAGIGGDNLGAGGNIKINGGTVTANGSNNAAGIGGGDTGDGGSIVISGGNVTANGGNNAAGIGGGNTGDGGSIVISGGNVTANGGNNAAGIGAGNGGGNGSFSTGTNGNAVITTNNGISDTSNQANWSAWVNNITYGNPVIPTNNNTSKRAFVLQIGETSGDADKLNVDIGPMNTEILGIRAVNINTQSDAGNAVDAVKTAIDRLSLQRANLGAYQNRLEHTINNLETTKVNIEASKSRIKDTDMAKQMMKYTQNNVLIQSAQAMLAQANTQPQQVLSLLQ